MPIIKPLKNNTQSVISPAVNPLANAMNETWILFCIMNDEA